MSVEVCDGCLQALTIARAPATQHSKTTIQLIDQKAPLKISKRIPLPMTDSIGSDPVDGRRFPDQTESCHCNRINAAQHCQQRRQRSLLFGAADHIHHHGSDGKILSNAARQKSPDLSCCFGDNAGQKDERKYSMSVFPRSITSSGGYRQAAMAGSPRPRRD